MVPLQKGLLQFITFIINVLNTFKADAITKKSGIAHYRSHRRQRKDFCCRRFYGEMHKLWSGLEVAPGNAAVVSHIPKAADLGRVGT